MHFTELSNIGKCLKKLVGMMIETNEVTFNTNICKVILINFFGCTTVEWSRLNGNLFKNILNL